VGTNADVKSHGGNPKCCWTIDNGVVVISKSISAMADKLTINGARLDPHLVLDAKANKTSLRQKRKQDGFVGNGGSFKYKKWVIFMGEAPEGYYDGKKIEPEKPVNNEFHIEEGVLLGKGYRFDKWDSSLMRYER